MIIKPNELEAIALASSDDQTRYYLNGVYIAGDMLVATDGHILMKLRDSTEKGFILGSGEIKKLLTMVKAARKDDKRAEILISLDYSPEKIACKIVKKVKDEITETGASLDCKELDGTFPDFRRVIPDLPKELQPSGGFNTDYLAAFGKAAKLLGKNLPHIQIISTGEPSPALVNIGIEDFKGVVMPCRM